jgi:PAS domain S-box-containing protein
MKKPADLPDALRTEAEAQLARARQADVTTRPAGELLHELQVHQIELEMQNDELRRTLLRLEESRDRYVDFYDFAPVGYLTLSSTALISEINLTGAALLGEARSKLVNRRFAPFVAPGDRSRWEQHFVDVLQHDGKLSCELDIRRGDGSHVHVHLDSLRLERDGKAPVVRVVLADISERKLAEAALRASEHHQRLLENQKIVQTSLDGFWVIRVSDTHILEVNDAFCDMVGYSREELLAMRIHDLEANEAPAETAAHIKRVMEIGHDRFETCHRHKQGHLVNLEISVSYSDIHGGTFFVFTRDISERKLLEQQLRLKEYALDQASDAVYLIDANLRFVYVNEAACLALGYSRDELLGLAPPDIDPDVTQEDVRHIHEQVLAKGMPTFETRHRRRDGSLFHVEIRPSVFEYQNQTMNLALARDISERKSAEQKLSELQYRNELILNTAGDGICGINEQGRINFANPAATKLLGYSIEELYGLSLEGISDGGACPDADCTFPNSAIGGTTCRRNEETYRRKDGSIFPVSCSRAPIIDHGKCIGAVVMFRDITERRWMEKALAASEREFRSLAENSPDIITRYDRLCRLVYLNPILEKALDADPSQLIGKMPAEFKLNQQINLDALEAKLGSVLKSEKSDEIEIEVIYPSGEHHIHHVRLAVERDIEGKVSGVLAIWRDITERKQAERQLRDLTSHLLTVREEEKASIAREIHDDLGGTLTALKMEAGWLADELSANKKTAPLLTHVEAMSALLDNAVAVTRRVITDLRPTILDDLGLLAALEWQCGQFQKRTGITCRVASTGDRKSDEKLDKTVSINLFRILQESLTNVARHSGATRVKVEFRHDGAEVMLEISDNGSGLQKGRAASSTTSYGIRGMCERVEQLGGRIDFGFPSDGGFSVTVKLPLEANNNIGEKHDPYNDRRRP